MPEASACATADHGRELAGLPLGRWIAMRHGAPYWVAHRSDLHGALEAAALTTAHPHPMGAAVTSPGRPWTASPSNWMARLASSAAR